MINLQYETNLRKKKHPQIHNSAKLNRLSVKCAVELLLHTKVRRVSIKIS